MFARLIGTKLRSKGSAGPYYRGVRKDHITAYEMLILLALKIPYQNTHVGIVVLVLTEAVRLLVRQYLFLRMYVQLSMFAYTFSRER